MSEAHRDVKWLVAVDEDATLGLAPPQAVVQAFSALRHKERSSRSVMTNEELQDLCQLLLRFFLCPQALVAAPQKGADEDEHGDGSGQTSASHDGARFVGYVEQVPAVAGGLFCLFRFVLRRAHAIVPEAVAASMRIHSVRSGAVTCVAGAVETLLSRSRLDSKRRGAAAASSDGNDESTPALWWSLRAGGARSRCLVPSLAPSVWSDPARRPSAIVHVRW